MVREYKKSVISVWLKVLMLGVAFFVVMFVVNELILKCVSLDDKLEKMPVSQRVTKRGPEYYFFKKHCGNWICDGTETYANCPSDCLNYGNTPLANMNYCGNGMIDRVVGEVCDDGNKTSGDGCSADCRSTELCGNGRIDGNEVCDDGNTVSGDGCNELCTSKELCGNGTVEYTADEQCEPPGVGNCSVTCRWWYPLPKR